MLVGILMLASILTGVNQFPTLKMPLQHTHPTTEVYFSSLFFSRKRWYANQSYLSVNSILPIQLISVSTKSRKPFSLRGCLGYSGWLLSATYNTPIKEKYCTHNLITMKNVGVSIGWDLGFIFYLLVCCWGCILDLTDSFGRLSFCCRCYSYLWPSPIG